MADGIDLQLHRHLCARLAAGGTTEQVGPFLAAWDPSNANPYLNYAVPDPGAIPGRDEVDTLVGWFRARERLARVEYFPSLAPAVEAALAGAGFEVELRPPVMVCRPAGPRPRHTPPSGCHLTMVDPGTAEDVAGAALVAHLAFGEPGAPGRDDLDRLAGMLRRGGRAVLARAAGGDPVGAAQCTPAVAGAGEVVGVAVDERWRRRGVATAMVSALLDRLAVDGLPLAWLSPGDDGAEQAYVRAGFTAVTGALHMRASA